MSKGKASDEGAKLSPSPSKKGSTKKKASVDVPTAEPAANVSYCKLVWLVVFGLFLYSVVHVNNTCPLYNPIDGSVSKYDVVCKGSHQIYDVADPYLHPYIDQAVDKYETSPVKEYIDKAHGAVTGVYDSHIKPFADKYVPEVKEGVHSVAQFVSDEALVLAVHTARYTKQGASYVAAQCEKHGAQFSDWLHTVFVPNVEQLAIKVKDDVLLLARKASVSIYVNFNAYIKPKLVELKDKIAASKLGDYWREFETTKFYQAVAYVLGKVSVTFKSVSASLSNFYTEFNEKDLKFKSSKPYKMAEQKTEFLRSELAKIFTPGFKVPSYKDLNVFQKKENEEEEAVEPSEPSNEPSESEAEPPSASTETLTAIEIIEEPSEDGSEVIDVVEEEIVIEEIIKEPVEEVIEKPVEEPIEDPATSAVSTKYTKLTENIISGAEQDFNEQAQAIADETREQLSVSLKPILSELGQKVNTGYSEIHDQLHNINRKSKGEDGYVSRQDYRDVLAKCTGEMNAMSEEIFSTLKEVEKNYTESVLQVRTSILETLSEFSDSTLTAYSNEIIRDGDDWNEWKRYNTVKKQLLNARDEILAATPPGEGQMFSSIEATANILLKEGQSYLAIMRAKGNLEFQSREKEERQARLAAEAAAKEADVEGDEEDEEKDEDYEDADETITGTITVYKTISSEAEVESDVGDAEESAEESAEEEYIEEGEYEISFETEEKSDESEESSTETSASSETSVSSVEEKITLNI